MDREIITTRTLKIWLGDDGIMRSNPLANAEMTLADAKEANEIIWKLSANKKRPLFCDYSGIRSQDAECRDYYASEETAAVTLVCAILVGSPVSKIIGNFYMGLNKPATPTRLFTSQDSAIAWLKGFLDE